jgi:hypothetical protein
MDHYDAFHQLWNESFASGFSAGFLAALVLGEVVLAVYLLDEDRANPFVVWKLRVIPVWAYWVTWGLLLVLLAGVPPLERWLCATPGSAANGLELPSGFPAGVVSAVVLFVGLRFAFPRWFVCPERVGNVVASTLAGWYGLLVLVHAVAPEAYWAWAPAAVSLLLLLGFIAALFAVFTYYARSHSPLLYPCLVGLVAVALFSPGCQTENRLPNMEDTASGGRTYYDEPFRLAGYRNVRTVAADKCGLVEDKEALRNWYQRVHQHYDYPQPIILVTVSGGASASAVYTADVLFTLEQRSPGFTDRVRIISGASGGMLGAAYFVTQLRKCGLIAEARSKPEYQEYLAALEAWKTSASDPKTKARMAAAQTNYDHLMADYRDRFFHGLEQDFLGPLVQKWVHQDMPLALFRRQTTNDRGAALETAWNRHLHNALDIPMRDLRDDERAGAIPSLVFTPMMVEDGRQLIISNLNLDYMVETARDPEKGRVTDDNPNGVMSYMGVEFFRMFPHADKFKLSTAVRLNASFPYFTPPAALPTDPVRHVVDAGYYDNYGTAVATKWLGANAEHLRGMYAQDKRHPGKPAEVLLIRIRCFGSEKARLQFVTDDELELYGRQEHVSPEAMRTPLSVIKQWTNTQSSKPVRTSDSTFGIIGPIMGAFASWDANMAYRADERLGSTVKLLMDGKGTGGTSLSIYPVECRASPSLNWVLHSHDLQMIHDDVKQNLNDALVLTRFPNSAGTATPPFPERLEMRQQQVNTANALGVALPKAVAENAPGFKLASPSSRVSIRAQADLAYKCNELLATPKPDVAAMLPAGVKE